MVPEIRRPRRSSQRIWAEFVLEAVLTVWSVVGAAWFCATGDWFAGVWTAILALGFAGLCVGSRHELKRRSADRETK